MLDVVQTILRILLPNGAEKTRCPNFPPLRNQSPSSIEDLVPSGEVEKMGTKSNMKI
jgi:hypothetical protein